VGPLVAGSRCRRERSRAPRFVSLQVCIRSFELRQLVAEAGVEADMVQHACNMMNANAHMLVASHSPLYLCPIDRAPNIQQRNYLVGGFWIFLSGAGVEHHDFLVGFYVTLGEQHLEPYEAHGGLGTNR
jgi:hypothetical protein